MAEKLKPDDLKDITKDSQNTFDFYMTQLEAMPDQQVASLDVAPIV